MLAMIYSRTIKSCKDAPPVPVWRVIIPYTITTFENAILARFGEKKENN